MFNFNKNKKAQLAGFYINLLIIAFIVIVVGTALINPIGSSTAQAQSTEGISGTASSTIIGLSPLMFIIMLIAFVGGLAIIALRMLGYL